MDGTDVGAWEREARPAEAGAGGPKPLLEWHAPVLIELSTRETEKQVLGPNEATTVYGATVAGPS
jgi:hypothetical protein